MKNQHLLALLQEGYTTIRVRFDGSRGSYVYKASKDVIVGDRVVVESVECQAGLKIAEVVEVHKTPQIDANATFEYKWIVQKVDRTFYDSVQKREAEFLEQLEEVERINARNKMLADAKASYPEGSEARAAFDAGTQIVFTGKRSKAENVKLIQMLRPVYLNTCIRATLGLRPNPTLLTGSDRKTGNQFHKMVTL